MVVHTTSMGGNFLLNFGPDGNGGFRKEERQIVESIGNWMAKNGEVIWDCGYAGWEKQDWGYFTRKNGSSSVNMIVFNQPVSGLLKVKVTGGVKIRSARSGGKSYRVEEIAKNEYLIHFTEKQLKEPQVIVLETEKTGKEGDRYRDALT